MPTSRASRSRLRTVTTVTAFTGSRSGPVTLIGNETVADRPAGSSGGATSERLTATVAPGSGFTASLTAARAARSTNSAGAGWPVISTAADVTWPAYFITRTDTVWARSSTETRTAAAPGETPPSARLHVPGAGPGVIAVVTIAAGLAATSGARDAPVTVIT